MEYDLSFLSCLHGTFFLKKINSIGVKENIIYQCIQCYIKNSFIVLLLDYTVHVKIKIFIRKKEILSIQNDGYLMDKMAKNVIMNKDCTLWRNDVSEKKQKGISGTDTDPAVWTEYDRSDRDVHSVWYMDRQEI